MNGYRQSNYDPEAYQQEGAPLRPYNWVQWTGIALGVVGLALVLADVAGELGWINPWFDGNPPLVLLLILGVVLINSRRAPATDVTPEQRAANRRMLFITLAISALVLGAAAIIDLTGAN
jgi:hypothetical protein